MKRFDPIHVPDAWEEHCSKLEYENRQAKASIFLLRKQLKSERIWGETSDSMILLLCAICTLAGFAIGIVMGSA